MADASKTTKPDKNALDHATTGAWSILALLTLANTLNFYDRTIPAVIVEPLKDEFGLSDSAIGVVSAAFVVLYAIAGVFLGRMADRHPRRLIMGWGLLTWSLLTALTGGAWSFAALVAARLGVGIGEASYSPAATSTISDLFRSHQRSRAIAIFTLGVPVGNTLAFLTTGFIVEAFGSWRAPFLLAAIPGVILAILLMRIKEPERGAAEDEPIASTRGADVAWTAVKRILSVPTMWWLIFAGIGAQCAAYSSATFLVPYFQRYFGFSLTEGGASTGLVLGVTGIVGLILGGIIADRASQTRLRNRVVVGGLVVLVSVPLTAWSLTLPSDAAGLFIVVFSIGWLFQFGFLTAALPAVADVIPPQLRSTAMALFFAAFYLLGGAFGPVVTGSLSDLLATGAVDGVSAEAHGLRLALLWVIPTTLTMSAIGLIASARTLERDHARMTAHTNDEESTS